MLLSVPKSLGKATQILFLRGEKIETIQPILWGSNLLSFLYPYFHAYLP